MFWHDAIFCQEVKDKSEQAKKYYAEAEWLYESGERERAIEYLDKAIESDKSFTDAYHLKGIILMESDNVKDRLKAQNVLEEAVKLDSENINYRLSLARCYQRRGFNRYALKEY